MGFEISVQELIMSFSQYLSSAMERFPKFVDTTNNKVDHGMTYVT